MKTLVASLILFASATHAAAQLPVVYPEDEELDDNYVTYDTGIGFTLGGGVSGFTGDTLRDTTDPGVDWTARLTFGLRSPLALELAYLGSAQNIEALGLDDDAVLVGNGAEGLIRLNAINPYLVVTPFVFGGLAWRHYDIVNSDVNTSALEADDDVFEFPVGAGISSSSNGILVDLRGEFRYVTEADLVRRFDTVVRGDTDAANMHRWGVTLTVGVEI